MPLVLADRVKETTTTSGTGTVTLLGASTGFQSFAVVGNANTTYYTIAAQTGTEWEVGIGTYTSSGTTLSRTTVLASSNSGSPVSFSAGTKDVFVTYPAGRSIYADGTTLTSTNNAILPRTSGGTGTATPSIVAGTNVTVSGTWPNQTVNSSGTVSPVFKGALLAQTSATTTITPINTYVNITFDTTVYDTAGGAFTGTSNRLTIPAGVSYVRLIGSILGTSATDQFIARIIKNGSATIYTTVNDTDTTGGDGVSALTPVLATVEGDYFQLQAFAAVVRNTTAGFSTWFSIEVVQGSILNVTV